MTRLFMILLLTIAAVGYTKPGTLGQGSIRLWRFLLTEPLPPQLLRSFLASDLLSLSPRRFRSLFTAASGPLPEYLWSRFRSNLRSSVFRSACSFCTTT